MNPNPNPPKHTGPPGRPQSPPRTEDVQKQPKPQTASTSSSTPKSVPAAQETSVRPSAAQGGAGQVVQSDAKATPPNKDSQPASHLTKAAATTSEPTPSTRKHGQPHTTAASNGKPLVSEPTTAATTSGQPMRTTADKIATGSTAAAKAGIVDSNSRAYVANSEHLGVAYPRATTLSEAVGGQVRMTEAMLDAMQGGSVPDNSVEPFSTARPSIPLVEPFSHARSSLNQVRYPTPYPTSVTPDDSQSEVVRDVDAIEVFKRRRASLPSDQDTTSLMQQATDRVKKASLRPPRTESIDEEHLLSKGERPLRSVLKPDGGAKKKKLVKFCDVEGTELSTIRFYFDQEEAPEVPLYATAYLNLEEIYNLEPKDRPTTDRKILRPSFSQPGAAPNFMGQVHINKVVLELCVVSDTEMNVTGTVRVANIEFSKTVTIRYTTDHWKHATDMKANYVYYLHDGATDRFSFVIQLPPTFGPGSQLQLAVKYEAGVETFWDNNSGQNYKVECYTREQLQNAVNTSYLSAIHPSFTWLQYL